MSVNGVTNSTSTYETAYQTSQPATATEKEQTTAASNEKETGVVYEQSKNAATTSSTKKTYTQNTDLVAKMKADQQSRQQQLQDIVNKMLSQQGDTYNKANGIWSILSSGNFTVDAATKAQAEKDISEDGYWGVKQTSERILDFATALTGGDPSQIEKMRAAFKKGYEQAEKTWGGKLPDISKQTYDAVMAGFDKMAEDAGITTNN